VNKRIRELAEQATVYHNGGLGTEIESFDKEKFAELIVQECCSAIRLDDVFNGGKFQRTILEHFGVEE
jgi:hypothetical protein